MVEINDLPDEVIEFILSYLPPYVDLENCRLVSKRWNSIVKNVTRRKKLSLNKGLCDFTLCWKSSSITNRSKDSSRTGVPDNITSAPTIAGRFSHSAVVHKNGMYIFGGGSSRDTTFNDLWKFDLSKRQWIRLLSMGSYPSPKGSASMVCYKDRLILFGGWRYPSLHPPHQPWCLFDELHLYDINDNRWTVQTSISGPPPMAGHSATVHKDKMIIFGGYQITNEINSNSNDTWCLNLINYTWIKPEISSIKPPPRYGHFQISLNEKKLLVVGGCGGPNNMFNDAWVLNMSGDIWQWKSIPVKNKKWSATHMWCNPACRVGDKLVVLGPTPNLPSDFQIIRQQRSAANRIRQNIPNDAPQRFNNHNNLIINEDQERRNRILNNLLQNNNFDNNNVRNNNSNNHHNVNNNNNRGINGADNVAIGGFGNNSNAGMNNQRRNPDQNYPQPAQNNLNRDEAASRLQRNLALRCRDEDHLNLPKRFDEPFEDRIRMAAFSVNENSRTTSQERQQERIRRMEEKMNALRNFRKNMEQKKEEPSPKRTKRNCLAMFVCDLSTVLDEEPYIEWIEYKNYGIIPGAPERLILSSIVAGNGELIMFGGVHKETLSALTHQVSNSVHILTAPKQII